MLILKTTDELKPWNDLKIYEMYCPICQAILTATNIEEVDSGYHDGYIFPHRAIPHYQEDLFALRLGIQ